MKPATILILTAIAITIANCICINWMNGQNRKRYQQDYTVHFLVSSNPIPDHVYEVDGLSNTNQLLK